MKPIFPFVLLAMLCALLPAQQALASLLDESTDAPMSASMDGRMDSQGRQAFDYLNDLRRQAGLLEFKPNPKLQLSAQSHAQYLFEHRQWGHQQQPGRNGYSGTTPQDRILAAGYSSRHNSENVSSHTGAASPIKSVNGLMSAIYHRFGFLSFDYDEIGVGHTTDGNYHRYVYNMGNSVKAQLCDSPEEPFMQGQYVYRVCANEDHKIKAGLFDKALTEVQLRNARLVVWPPKSGEAIPPAFYKEAPDPLPAYDVSGYPVSVQFNPVYYRDAPPQVTEFSLVSLPELEPVEVITYFNEKTDINSRFTAYEHAIFPRQRLAWDTLYQAEVRYRVADEPEQSLQWTFRTASFDLPLYQVQGGEVISPQQASVVVYSPPRSRNDARSEYQVSFRGFSDMKVEIFDPHTLVITPVGRRGHALFDFHGKRFSIVRD